MKFTFFVLASFLLAATSVLAQQDEVQTESGKKVSDVSDKEDPYLWLEDVTGTEALDWVRERNKKTQSHFEVYSEHRSAYQDN